MSLPQPPLRRPPGPLLILVAASLAAAAVAALALAPVADVVARTAARAQPLHVPDLTLVRAESLIVQAHLMSAIAALMLGAVLLLSRKGELFHRIAGWTWAGLMALVAGTALFITERNGGWSVIHLTVVLVVVLLPLALAAARRHAVRRHRALMLWLYFAGLLGAGLFAFVPGRLMWTLFFG